MTDATLFEKYADASQTDLGLYYCGKRTRTKNHAYGPETRAHFLLVLVEKGTAVLHVQNRLIPFGSGDLLVMFPGERIEYHAQTEWSIRWLGITGREPEAVFANIGVTRLKPIFRPSRFDELCELMTEIFKLQYNGSMYVNYQLQSLLHRFFAVLSADEIMHERPDPIETALRMIQYNLTGSVSVRTLADSVFLEESYFTRLFKKRIGITPKAYMQCRRIKRAKELLRAGSSVKEAALAAGFRDPLYFSRVFVKAEGIAPSDYRALQIEKQLDDEKKK